MRNIHDEILDLLDGIPMPPLSRFHRQRPDKFRPDGTPYPPGDIGLMMWARDSECMGNKILEMDFSLYGEEVSTVWLGLDHSFGFGEPLIFETMIFGIDGRSRDLQWRYQTYVDALRGHQRALVFSLIPPPLRSAWWAEHLNDLVSQRSSLVF